MSSSTDGAEGAQCRRDDVGDDSDEQDAAPPESVGQRSGDQLSGGESDEARGDRELRDRGDRTQFEAEGG